MYAKKKSAGEMIEVSSSAGSAPWFPPARQAVETLHCRLYFRHDVPQKHKLLKLWLESDIQEERLALATLINPERAPVLCEAFESGLIDSFYEQVFIDETEDVGGFWRSSLILDQGGDDVCAGLVNFINLLGGRAQAWGWGGDDPREVWFKYANGRVIRYDHAPYLNETADIHASQTLYCWWHETLPQGVREGFLQSLKPACA